jgi:hypothetical protein
MRNMRTALLSNNGKSRVESKQVLGRIITSSIIFGTSSGVHRSIYGLKTCARLKNMIHKHAATINRKRKRALVIWKGKH